MVVVVAVVVVSDRMSVDSEIYFVDAHAHCVDPLYAAQVTITHECRAYVNHCFWIEIDDGWKRMATIDKLTS